MSKPNGKAVVTRSTFRFECAVAIHIQAPREKVWYLLTSNYEFPKWSSIFLSIDGAIALNSEIRIKAAIDPNRTFNLRVTEFQPPSKMVWSDGFILFLRGDRTFNLVAQPDGSTDLYFTQVFKGPGLPLIAGSMPDFGSEFEKAFAGLKVAAENPST